MADRELKAREDVDVTSTRGRRGLLFPLLILAAVAVIVLCMIGVVAITEVPAVK